jgi:hypothetical protein
VLGVERDTSNAGARRRIGTRSGTEGQPDQANRMGLFAGQCVFAR